jgi:hypothetical protein
MTQQVVFSLNSTDSSNHTMTLEYEFSSNKWAKILLILGYVAGGVLIVGTVVMIVVIIRRNRHEEQERMERAQEQNGDKNDISHFNALMPLATINVKDLKDGRTCSVCLVEIDFNSMVRNTVCGHLFHSKCIDEWCAKNLSCPICRTNLSRENILELRNEQSRKES